MPDSAAYQLFRRWVQAIQDLDFDTMEELVHPDFVGDYPQSGERFRGFPALRAQLERYPGGLRSGRLPATQTKLIGGEERWAIGPNYTVLPVIGPERYTVVARAVYPDESRWWVVSIVELKDGKIYRNETYFAPDFEAPEWRKDIVERIPSTD